MVLPQVVDGGMAAPELSFEWKPRCKWKLLRPNRKAPLFIDDSGLNCIFCSACVLIIRRVFSGKFLQRKPRLRLKGIYFF
jgi:hypothetical protein